MDVWGLQLIPEENVEEINLNYKDGASLESGSGRAAEGREGKEGETGEEEGKQPLLLSFSVFWSPFSFLVSFLLILWE